MKNEIKFNPFDSVKNHTSDEIISLNADERANSLNSIKEMIHGLQFLAEEISKEKLIVSTRYNVLSIVGYKIKDLREILRGNEDLKQDEERDVLTIRHLNEEISNLRNQLGKDLSSDAIIGRLYQLKEDVYDFWKKLGFLHADIKFSSAFNSTYLSCEFSCYIDNHISTMSKTPISDKQALSEKIEKLKQTIELAKISTGLVMVDSEKNRSWITETLEKRYPNFRIQSIKCNNHDKICYIRKINAMIDIRDI
jgi:hypothetical protein